MPVTAANWSLPQLQLKRWLRGRWALLFSHPDDFACYGFEADRWIAQVKEAFDAESVAALAISGRAAADTEGWIAAVGGRFISSRVFESIAAKHGSVHRWVIVLDGGLQVRRSFEYTSVHQLPSPIDLASLAAVFRVRAQARERYIA